MTGSYPLGIALVSASLIAVGTWLSPLLLLAGWLLVPALILAQRWPVMLCVLFVLFSAFRLHELNPALLSLRIPQLLALGSLAVLFWQVGVVRETRIFLYPEGRILLLLFALSSIGVVLATNRPLALAYWSGNWIKVVLMCFTISWLIQSWTQLRWVAWLIILAGSVVASCALYNSAHGLEMVEGTRVTIGRSWGSTLGDPNDLALVLLLPLSFAFSRALYGGNGALVAGVIVLTLVMAIIATQSRGGLLGICGVAGSVMLWRYRLPRWVWLLAPVMILVLLMVAGIDQRQSGGAAESGIDESAMGRLYAWQAALSMAWSHPVLGVGLDNFFSNYFFHSPHWDGKSHAVHSSWFQVLAEMGIVGLMLFVAFYVALLRRSRKLLNRVSERWEARCWSLALYSGLVGFGISATFLTQAFTWPLYILAALLWASCRIESQPVRQRR
ncbi:O-antigen ligase [Ferrimonas sediminum]|uniref:O-antigen ligase n=1 Tax=Ferrimonas sediminum TaxID=718193 RepID=A0A1G8S619_9GAMM|nr:O-antigen ligase family protein [Ferrimonas sediminum]SDJ24636.1 O-antigen ligase [Ferrimonas sediminum]